MKLSELLKRENNNLDLVRILAACLVIYGHSYALVAHSSGGDLILKYIKFEYAGSLAVKIFFFISGLVVTNSLLKSKDVGAMIASRIYRIFPALIVTTTIVTFVISPFFKENFSLSYFFAKDTLRYYIKTSLAMPILRIPGVYGYADDATTYINASVWTITYELAAYATLVALFVCGVFRRHFIAILTFSLIVGVSLFQPSGFLSFAQQDMERSMLPFCFAFGSILAFYKEKITLKLHMSILLWISYFIVNNNAIGVYIFYTSCLYSIILISGMSWFMRLKPKLDISYGVYLWGWPVQQVLAHAYPNSGIFLHISISIFISLVLGYLSWKLVECRAISYGKCIAIELAHDIKKK